MSTLKLISEDKLNYISGGEGGEEILDVAPVATLNTEEITSVIDSIPVEVPVEVKPANPNDRWWRNH